MIHKSNRVLKILFLQLSVIIYTMAGVASKLASHYEIFSFKFILMCAIEVTILGIYAILWQQIIKNTDLFVAYANKGTSLLWSIVWASLLFKETISVANVIGIVVVMTGVMLINSDDVKKETSKG